MKRPLNRKETRRIEQILGRLSGEKISEVVSFKVQPSVRRFLKDLGNPSGFARQAVLEKLRSLLDDEPTCGGCRFWSGRCLRGKLNRIAACPACEMHERRVR